MGNYIYVACAVSVDIKDLNIVRNQLAGYGHTVISWDRNRPYAYDNHWLKDSEAVVFILPNMAWLGRKDNLPIGLESELRRAEQFHKKLFLAYKTISGDIRIYEAEITTLSISGKNGSSNVIESLKISKEECVLWDGSFIDKLSPKCGRNIPNDEVNIGLFNGIGPELRLLLRKK